MTLFGLDRREVETALTRLGVESDDGTTAELFARAAWSGIAEPGDSMAGFLVSHVGASGALTMLIDHWSTARILDAVANGIAGSDLQAVASQVENATARWRPRLDSRSALQQLSLAAACHATLLTPGNPAWPDRIDDLGLHTPLALWVRGNPAALRSTSRSLALVGARAATGYGEHVATEAASGLASRGFTVVSGAAYGIDGMAHRAALATQGTTVAFLAGGVDRPYPSGHSVLIGRIIETGAVVSEIPCGGAPSKWRFLQRNRLIAAVSEATVVLEAGWRSGSLNTAGHAAALGRPLGAVPGPVTSAASAGCHRLIREYGAVCVTTVDEMVELVGDSVPGAEPGGGGRSSDEIRVLDALSVRSVRTPEDVAVRTGLPVDTVHSALGILELDARVAERPGGWVYLPQAR
ncbi:DNA-protecting protein DprA [Mycetocola manganoxydans]|uniref:DNA-protecting protein DprA n=1 Tax=Mycetocola manganoxydans TaxID=699879 RepID=A0A3L6ZUE2_9MICO|nr:DNA-processing protein DprA [Mycetocola manganoxydans]RLP71606.1 DNA-protecting protein DprA [Mycetocola manganoxydans]GHD38695.1 DNA processing protein DprA [Mycetocola manganoxydans]